MIGLIDFFVPEIVEVMMAERRQAAESVRIESDALKSRGRGPRRRLAGILGGLALSVHAEAARNAVGLCCCPDPNT